ncbi:tyrosine-type recombinase/integrase [Hallella seregens]|uniref:Tyrosine-type recombinase/integrase n=1 Tax=Hallella seregens ATCC 51272 TaxID=1336250 RepID=A0ABV5ZGE3_9BACT|nr:tyrosine-type recombinase/integrase [Hallella seregens]
MNDIFHMARHTFATIMREKGYDADVVCIMLGHADDTMVKEVYAHNDDTLKTAKLKRAMAKVEGEKSSKSALQLLFAYDKLKELERKKEG